MYSAQPLTLSRTLQPLSPTLGSPAATLTRADSGRRVRADADAHPTSAAGAHRVYDDDNEEDDGEEDDGEKDDVEEDDDEEDDEEEDDDDEDHDEEDHEEEYDDEEDEPQPKKARRAKKYLAPIAHPAGKLSMCGALYSVEKERLFSHDVRSHFDCSVHSMVDARVTGKDGTSRVCFCFVRFHLVSCL
jgi:hypothetical protein